MKPKPYFRQPTAAQIRRYKTIREISDHVVDNVLDLKDSEAAIIRADLIPRQFDGARRFMKHGDEVKIRRFRTLEGTLKARRTPVQLREEAFNSLRQPPYCGYSFKPVLGTDRRTRKVSLVECLEGTKLYCYAQQTPLLSEIEIRPYQDARRIDREGAKIIVSVPSRMQKSPRYEFKFSSVPIADSIHKWAIAHGIVTDHNCKSTRFNIRYTYADDKEGSDNFNFCAHEIAAYLSLMDHYLKFRKNIIPLQMSQFAIPTQQTVDFYVRLCNNCLIQTEKDQKPRKLNRAEKEILLWDLIRELGHDDTFFATEKVRDYNWH